MSKVTISKQDWATIAAAGIPITHEGAVLNFAGFENLVPVLLKVLDADNQPKLYDSIRGWLIALRGHYPSLYQQYFQDLRFSKVVEGPVLGRDIKLRRIALSHLGKIA